MELPSSIEAEDDGGDGATKSVIPPLVEGDMIVQNILLLGTLFNVLHANKQHEHSLNIVESSSDDELLQVKNDHWGVKTVN